MGDYRETFTQFTHYTQQDAQHNILFEQKIEKIILCCTGKSKSLYHLVKYFLREQGIDVVVHEHGTLASHYMQPHSLIVIYSLDHMQQVYKQCLRQKQPMLVLGQNHTIITSAQRKKVPHVLLAPDSFLQMTSYFQAIQLLYALSSQVHLIKTMQQELMRLSESFPFAKRSNAMAKRAEKKKVIIYATPSLFQVLGHWKLQCAYNAKQLIHIGNTTAVIHDQIEAFEQPQKDTILYFFQREHDSQLIKKEVAQIHQLVRSQVDFAKVYDVPGRNTLVSAFLFAHLGDWFTYQWAEHLGANPYKATMINELLLP
ncbi:MAG: SIS domain-containing protein [Candidatus Woesearchaeota archaeon]